MPKLRLDFKKRTVGLFQALTTNIHLDYLTSKISHNINISGTDEFGGIKKISISNTNVDTDLTDFPLQVVFENDSELGLVMGNNGYDIEFRDADQETVLPHELAYFNIESDLASGKYFVKIPTVSSSSVTEIYMYYGKASVTVDPSDSPLVWSTYHSTVNHFKILPEQLVIAPTTKVIDPNVRVLSNSDVLMTARFDNDIKTYKSTDDGISFTELSTVKTGGSPSMWILNNGDVMVIYAVADSVAYKISSDSGVTWGSEKIVDSVEASQELSVYQSPSGTHQDRIYVTGDSISSGDLWVRYSDDLLGAWSNRVVLEANSVFSHEGKSIIQAPNGNILIASEEEEVEKGTSRIKMWTSTDGGATWSSSVVIWEAIGGTDNEEGEFILTDNNEIWYISSTDEDDIYKQSYPNSMIKYVKSLDNGITWSSTEIIRPLSACSNITVTKLLDGRLLIVWNDLGLNYTRSQVFSLITSVSEIQSGLLYKDRKDSTGNENNLDGLNGSITKDGLFFNGYGGLASQKPTAINNIKAISFLMSYNGYNYSNTESRVVDWYEDNSNRSSFLIGRPGSHAHEMNYALFSSGVLYGGWTGHIIPNDGSTHHYIIQSDGSNIKIFVDNVEKFSVVSNKLLSSIAPEQHELSRYSSPNTLIDPFFGSIKEIRYTANVYTDEFRKFEYHNLSSINNELTFTIA
jgi:hypothetical protein